MVSLGVNASIKCISLLFCVFLAEVRAQLNQQDSSRNLGLQQEVFLHPAGGFTAQTLNKKQWQYSQIIDLKPGILHWGVTDWLTLSLPVNHWFTKAISINVRTRFKRQNRFFPAMALETHYQYLFKPLNLVGEVNAIEVWRLGHNKYAKIIAAWKVRKKWNIHLSFGGTYSQVLNFNIVDSTSANDEVYGNNLSPDGALNLDFLMRRGITLHSMISYGSTFLYVDNTPRKKQISFAVRFAPFLKSQKGFLKNFRMECVYFYMRFGNTLQPYTSVSGKLYWQGKIGKRKKN